MYGSGAGFEVEAGGEGALGRLYAQAATSRAAALPLRHKLLPNGPLGCVSLNDGLGKPEAYLDAAGPDAADLGLWVPPAKPVSGAGPVYTGRLDGIAVADRPRDKNDFNSLRMEQRLLGGEAASYDAVSAAAELDRDAARLDTLAREAEAAAVAAAAKLSATSGLAPPVAPFDEEAALQRILQQRASAAKEALAASLPQPPEEKPFDEAAAREEANAELAAARSAAALGEPPAPPAEPLPVERPAAFDEAAARAEAETAQPSAQSTGAAGAFAEAPFDEAAARSAAEAALPLVEPQEAAVAAPFDAAEAERQARERIARPADVTATAGKAAPFDEAAAVAAAEERLGAAAAPAEAPSVPPADAFDEEGALKEVQVARAAEREGAAVEDEAAELEVVQKLVLEKREAHETKQREASAVHAAALEAHAAALEAASAERKAAVHAAVEELRAEHDKAVAGVSEAHEAAEEAMKAYEAEVAAAVQAARESHEAQAAASAASAAADVAALQEARVASIDTSIEEARAAHDKAQQEGREAHEKSAEAATAAAAERSAAVEAAVAAARVAAEQAMIKADAEAARRAKEYKAAQEAYAAALVAVEKAQQPDEAKDTAFVEQRVEVARKAAVEHHAELVAIYEAAKVENEKRVTAKGEGDEAELAAARSEVAVLRTKAAEEAAATAAAAEKGKADVEAAAAAAKQRAQNARGAAEQAKTWAVQAKQRLEAGDAGGDLAEKARREAYRHRWTDESGQPSHLPDPSDRNRSRTPYVYDPAADYLEIEPTRVLFDTGADVQARAYQLNVELGRVDLFDHALMAREEVLAAALDSSLDVYERRAKKGMVAFRASQADALADALDKAMGEAERRGGLEALRQKAAEPSPEATVGSAEDEAVQCAALLERVERLQVEVADSSELRDAEEAQEIAHVGHIRAIFEELQEVRRSQGFAATTQAVSFKQVPGNAQADAHRERRAVAGQVRQMEARHKSTQDAMLHDHGLAVAAAQQQLEVARSRADEGARLRREAAAKPGAPTEATETERAQAEADLQAIAVAESELDRLKVAAPVTRAFDATAAADAVIAARRSAGTEIQAGAARLVPVRATTPRHEPTLPQAEVARRRRLAAMRVYARVMVDGREAGVTPPAAPAGVSSMSFELGTLLSLQVRACPHELRVDIYERSFPADRQVASVYLAVPGTNGAPLVYERPGSFEFTGEEPFASPWDRAPGGGLRQGASLRYAHGALQARLAWTGEVSAAAVGGEPVDVEAAAARGEAGDRAPPPIATAEADPHVIVHGRTSAARGAQGRRAAPFAAPGSLAEPRLAKWIAQTRRTLDPNDPRNAHLVDALGHVQGSSAAAARAAGARPAGYRLGADDVAALEYGPMGARARLLRVRWDRAVKLDLEVPLLDSELDAQQTEVLEQAEGRAQSAAMSRHRPGRAMTISSAASDAALQMREATRLALRDRLAQALPAAAVRGGVPLPGGIGSGPASAALRARLRPAARLEDVVKDTPLPEFGMNLRWLGELLRPRRKLKPSITTEVVRTTHPEVCQVSIYVSKAYNVPLRVTDAAEEAGRQSAFRGLAGGLPLGAQRPGAFGAPAAGDLEGALLGDPVLDGGAAGGGATGGGTRACTFIEATFQGRTVRTRAVEGGAPVWSEQLLLPFSPPKGGSAPSVLHALQEQLVLTLYDDVPDATGQVDAAGCCRTMRRYLGRAVVPIGEVCRAGQLRGPLRVATPAALLGYRRQRGGGAGDLPLLFASCSLQPQLSPEVFAIDDETTSLSEDALGVAGDMGLTAAPTVEDANLLAQARQWEADCRTRQLPGQAIVRDAEGAAVLACRYISNLAPPQTLGLPADASSIGDRGMMQMLRFVSLYPDPPEWMDTFKADRVWMRHGECVECSMAGGAERALMLASMFRWAGVDAYVARDVNAAEACYVVTLSGVNGVDGARRVWCPGSARGCGEGAVYDVSDVSCELSAVATLLGPSNAYLNLQPNLAPWELSWELWDARSWHAMLPRTTPPGRGARVEAPALATVQAQPQYIAAAALSMRGVEEALERRVMDSLSAARKMHYTHFSRRCSKALKPLLQELEAARVAGGAYGAAPGGAAGGIMEGAAEAAHERALENFSRTYRFTGYPICMPLSDIDACVERALSTGVHLDTQQGVEFAVATLVAPAGAGAVAAAWVYLALLVRKN